MLIRTLSSERRFIFGSVYTYMFQQGSPSTTLPLRHIDRQRQNTGVPARLQTGSRAYLCVLLSLFR